MTIAKLVERIAATSKAGSQDINADIREAFQRFAGPWLRQNPKGFAGKKAQDVAAQFCRAVESEMAGSVSAGPGRLQLVIHASLSRSGKGLDYTSMRNQRQPIAAWFLRLEHLAAQVRTFESERDLAKTAVIVKLEMRRVAADAFRADRGTRSIDPLTLRQPLLDKIAAMFSEDETKLDHEQVSKWAEVFDECAAPIRIKTLTMQVWDFFGADDSAAFGELYKHWTPILRAHLLRTASDQSHKLDDIVSDALTSLSLYTPPHLMENKFEFWRLLYRFGRRAMLGQLPQLEEQPLPDNDEAWLWDRMKHEVSPWIQYRPVVPEFIEYLEGIDKKLADLAMAKWGMGFSDLDIVNFTPLTDADLDFYATQLGIYYDRFLSASLGDSRATINRWINKIRSQAKGYAEPIEYELYVVQENATVGENSDKIKWEGEPIKSGTALLLKCRSLRSCTVNLDPVGPVEFGKEGTGTITFTPARSTLYALRVRETLGATSTAEPKAWTLPFYVQVIDKESRLNLSMTPSLLSSGEVATCTWNWSDGRKVSGAVRLLPGGYVVTGWAHIRPSSGIEYSVEAPAGGTVYAAKQTPLIRGWNQDEREPVDGVIEQCVQEPSAVAGQTELRWTSKAPADAVVWLEPGGLIVHTSGQINVISELGTTHWLVVDTEQGRARRAFERSQFASLG